ncbi:MAG: hypothetical protein ACE5GM_05085 [bacterium]
MKINRSLVSRAQLSQILLIMVAVSYLIIRVGGGILEKSLTYGNLSLSFNSRLLSTKAEVSYRQGDLFIASPQYGYSTRIPHNKIKRFIRKYHLYLKVGFYNALFTLLLVMGIIFLLMILLQLDRVLKLISGLVGSAHRTLLGLIVLLFFLASFFPVAGYYGWLSPLNFIRRFPPPSSIENIIHDFGGLFVVAKKYKRFYAGLFTIPVYLLDLVGIASILALVFRWFRFPEFLGKLLDKVKGLIGRFHKPLVYFFLSFVFLFGFISFLNSGGQPRQPEGVAALFQSRIFARGAVAVPVNFDREFFGYPYLTIKQYWFSRLPPGLSLLLLPGVLIGIPWLVFPLLGALSGFLLYKLARDWYGENTALVCLGLWTCSPAVLLVTGDFLVYLPFFSCLLGFLLINQFNRQPDSPAFSSRSALVSGVLLGIMFLLSPGRALLVIIPFTGYLSYLMLKNKAGKAWRVMMAVFLAIGAVDPIFNMIVSGRFFIFNYGSLYGQGIARSMQSLESSLLHLLYQLNGLNRDLFGWPLPSLIFLFLFLLNRRSSKQTTDRLMIISVLVFLAFSFRWHDSFAYKSNPLYLLLPFLVLLSVRGIALLPGWLADLLSRDQTEIHRLTWLLLIILIAFNLKGNLKRFNPVRESSLTGIQQSMKGKSVLLLKEKDAGEIYYQAFGLNRPSLEAGDIIVARDLGKYNRKLFKTFKGRTFYAYQPDSPEILKQLPLQ